MALSDHIEKLYDLRRDRSAGYEKPYKPALLLTLIDLVEQGEVLDNRFLLTPELFERYKDYLRVVGGSDDHCRIQYPFWHLCGDGLWMCYDAKGQPLYQAGTNAASSPSVKWLRDHMSHASLDPELFQFLLRPPDREYIRRLLFDRYFPKQRELLWALLGIETEPMQAAEAGADYNVDPIRTAAFAKTVKAVYDFRCAASGLRFRFKDLSIVDACHLIPFAESHNDHPTNGMALSKNHHWAFDRHLISPTHSESGLIWKVSPLLDDRIEGHRELIELDGRSVLVPKEKKFFPADEAIAWRAEHLLVG
ncbi:MAG: HNH endonuclease [Opitutaceae bacterium]